MRPPSGSYANHNLQQIVPALVMSRRRITRTTTRRCCLAASDSRCMLLDGAAREPGVLVRASRASADGNLDEVFSSVSRETSAPCRFDDDGMTANGLEHRRVPSRAGKGSKEGHSLDPRRAAASPFWVSPATKTSSSPASLPFSLLVEAKTASSPLLWSPRGGDERAVAVAVAAAGRRRRTESAWFSFRP